MERQVNNGEHSFIPVLTYVCIDVEVKTSTVNKVYTVIQIITV